MDTLAACKAAVTWVKGRTAVNTKQISLRAAVDAASQQFHYVNVNSPFDVSKKHVGEKRK